MQRGPPVRDPTPWDAVLTVGRRPPGRKGPPRESRHTRHSGKWEKDQEAGRHRHFHGQQQGGRDSGMSSARWAPQGAQRWLFSAVQVPEKRSCSRTRPRDADGLAGSRITETGCRSPGGAISMTRGEAGSARGWRAERRRSSGGTVFPRTRQTRGQRHRALWSIKEKEKSKVNQCRLRAAGQEQVTVPCMVSGSEPDCGPTARRPLTEGRAEFL